MPSLSALPPRHRLPLCLAFPFGFLTESGLLQFAAVSPSLKQSCNITAGGTSRLAEIRAFAPAAEFLRVSQSHWLNTARSIQARSDQSAELSNIQTSASY